MNIITEKELHDILIPLEQATQRMLETIDKLKSSKVQITDQHYRMFLDTLVTISDIEVNLRDIYEPIQGEDV